MHRFYRILPLSLRHISDMYRHPATGKDSDPDKKFFHLPVSAIGLLLRLQALDSNHDPGLHLSE